VHGHCERARQWASAAVDGELSTFERVLLEDHLGRCGSCREFSHDVNGMTSALRAAPLEQFDGVVLGRIRRQVRLRLAPAAAAMAIAAVGLGSLVASTQFSRTPVIGPAEVSPATIVRSDFALNSRRTERLKAAPRTRMLLALPGRPGPVLP
jgi:predicted anti-sigma-YlaC factor YlaD